MALNINNIVFCNKLPFLSIITSKNQQQLTIPLSPLALQIALKYAAQQHNKALLPKISNTNFNLNFKKLAKTAGWVEAVPKFQATKGRLKELVDHNNHSLPFYKQVSAHTLRRTAITNLLIMGVEEQAVRKLSGHAPNSKEFYKYVIIADNFANQQITDAQQLWLIP